MDLNKAMIIGRLTRDPETRTIPSGQTVTSFGVATNRVWTDAASQKQEAVEFHNVVAWRGLAEICSQYLRKGSKIYIEGALQTRKWQDQSGQDKYSTEVVLQRYRGELTMLDSRGEGGGGGGYGGGQGGDNYNQDTNQGGGAASGGAPSGGVGDLDDEIPF